MEVRRMSRANMATLMGLLFSVIMVMFFILAEITKRYMLFWLLALISFLVSMILDAVDGYFARKDKTENEIGATLDQIRDKMTMLMVFSPLVAYGVIHWLFLIIIVFREFFVLMVRMIYLLMKNHPSPTPQQNLGVSAKIWGKIKTISQTISGAIFVIALLNYNHQIHIQWFYELIPPYQYNEDWQLTHLILQIVIATISVFTGIMYGVMYKDFLGRAFMDIIEKEKNLKHQTGPQPVAKED